MSTEECGIVASKLPAVTKTKREAVSDGRAKQVVLDCTKRIRDLVKYAYNNKYNFKKALSRHQPLSAPGKLHQDGPQDEHTYDLRVCVRVPRDGRPSHVHLEALDNSARHSFIIQAGQVWASPWLALGWCKMLPMACPCLLMPCCNLS